MLKQSSSRIKKVLAILLEALFVVSVTSAAVSAKPVMVKEKKTIIIIFQDVKTKIYKWPHHHHHSKDMDMKNMDMKNMDMKNMDMKNMDMKNMDSETGDGY